MTPQRPQFTRKIADVKFDESSDIIRLKRHLSAVQDERDQLKSMLVTIRQRFTAESRLREFLEKMRTTVVKVLADDSADADDRILEALHILSSWNSQDCETLQTTGDFLADLSYTDQETIYGIVPTSDQRKKVLKSGKSSGVDQTLITNGPDELPGGAPGHATNGLARPSGRKCLNFQTIGCAQEQIHSIFNLSARSGEVSRYSEATETDENDNESQKGSKRTICDVTVNSAPASPPGSNFRWQASRLGNIKKHRFILWLGKKPDLCDYCKHRVLYMDAVRKCACGMFVHRKRCEHDGECPGPDMFKNPATLLP